MKYSLLTLLIVTTIACNPCRKTECEKGECVDGECACETYFIGENCDTHEFARISGNHTAEKVKYEYNYGSTSSNGGGQVLKWVAIDTTYESYNISIDADRLTCTTGDFSLEIEFVRLDINDRGYAGIVGHNHPDVADVLIFKDEGIIATGYLFDEQVVSDEVVEDPKFDFYVESGAQIDPEIGTIAYSYYINLR